MEILKTQVCSKIPLSKKKSFDISDNDISMKMHSRNKLLSEAATGRVLFKKTLLKKIPKQMFCYKVFELFKNNYFEEHLQMNTSILFRNGEPQIKKDGDEDFNG